MGDENGSSLEPAGREEVVKKRPDAFALVMEDLAHTLVDRGEILWNQTLAAWSSRYGSGERHDSREDNDLRNEYTEAETPAANDSDEDEESCEEYEEEEVEIE